MTEANPSLERMVREQLEDRGIRNRQVLDAMRRIPRALFVPDHLSDRAYADAALPIACGQTISQPYIVASMTESLEIAPSHHVLEIGTGSGYQTAILCCLAREVYSIERIPGLAAAAAPRLRGLGLSNVRLLVADGTLGWPSQNLRFDRILVSAAAPTLVQPLFEQLVEGGRMILPMGPEGDQRLVRVDRVNGQPVQQELYAVRFVRLVGKAAFDR